MKVLIYPNLFKIVYMNQTFRSLAGLPKGPKTAHCHGKCCSN